MLDEIISRFPDAPPLPRLKLQTAPALAYRLAVMGLEPIETRRAIEQYLGRTLVSLPALYAECRAAFYDGQQRRAARNIKK